MEALNIILLIFILVCAVAVSSAKSLLASVIILAVCPLVIGAYDFLPETRDIAYQLMYSVAVMVIFQAREFKQPRRGKRG